VFVLLAPATVGVLVLLLPAGGAAAVDGAEASAPACAWRWLSLAPAQNAESVSPLSMLLAPGARV
jgi:hypothetical protein